MENLRPVTSRDQQRQEGGSRGAEVRGCSWTQAKAIDRSQTPTARSQDMFCTSQKNAKCQHTAAARVTPSGTRSGLSSDELASTETVIAAVTSEAALPPPPPHSTSSTCRTPMATCKYSQAPCGSGSAPQRRHQAAWHLCNYTRNTTQLPPSFLPPRWCGDGASSPKHALT